jgi:predicted ATPase
MFIRLNNSLLYSGEKWWDSIALQEGEENVLRVVQVIAPHVERVSLIKNPIYKNERFFIAKLHGEREPVALRSLGDGVYRAFEVALGIEYAKESQIVLLDEIEAGIHYSKQAEFLKTLFALAKQKNLQIFATTHSWDCIEAFQEASETLPELAASLVRLEKKGDDVQAVCFNREEFAAVTRHSIEVR